MTRLLVFGFCVVCEGFGQTPHASASQTPAVGAVVGPAGTGQAGVAAGSLATIVGTNLAAQLASYSTPPLSTTLADVTSVTVAGIAAPLTIVSGTQINVQIPWEVAPGQAVVVVNSSAGTSKPFNVQVGPIAPAILSLNLGALQALAQNADGSLVAAVGFLAGLPAHPATAGDTITIWMTGLGPVTGAATGQLAPDNSQQALTPPVVLIGGIPAQVLSTSMSTQYVGVYQVQLVVPAGTGTGSAVPVQVQTTGVTGPDPVTMAIQ